MNSYTGEIKPAKEIMEFFHGKKGNPEDWFVIDNNPDESCDACSGNGWVGYTHNNKVIPCACVFESIQRWAIAVREQRGLKRKSKDDFKDYVDNQR